MAKTNKKSEKKSATNPKVKEAKKERKAAPAKTPITSKEIIAKAQSSKSKSTPAATNGKSKAGKDSSEESSEESSDEEEKSKAAQVKKTVPAKAAAVKVKPTKAVSSSSASDSESESSSDEKPAPKASAPVTRAAPSLTTEDLSSSEDESEEESSKAVSSTVASKKAESSDSDSSSEDEAPKLKATAGATAKANPPKKAASSDEDSDSSEEDSDDKAKTTRKRVASSDESSDSSSDEDGDVKMGDATKQPVNGTKRKAAEDTQPQAKKLKLANGDTAPAGAGAEESKTVFVGRLSWSVDNDRLAQEFAHCGEVESATVQVDRDSGKSRGFGYVRFTTASAVEKALEMSGKEIDGRPINVDRSTSPDKSQIRDKRAKAFGDEVSPPSSTLFVGNLSFGVSEDTVWSFFNDYGVKNVRLPTDRETGRPKGFGYVEFEDIEGAKKAFAAANGAEIEGRSIRLDYSQPRDSSSGGGGGGRGGGRGFGDRGGRGGRGFGDRGGRGRGRGFGDRGGRGGRGRGGDRGGRGAPRGNVRSGGIAAFEGKKITF